MKIESAVISNVGRVRSNNEDNYFLNGSFRENVLENNQQNVLEMNEKKMVFSVCDGMGGEEYGEIASLCAVKSLPVFKEKEWSRQTMEEFLKRTEKNMKEQQEKEDRRMGTTIVILTLENNIAYAANMGDSRLYLFRKKKLQCLSYDHTQAQLLIHHGLLQKEEARNHRGNHILTRFLGNHENMSAEDFYQIRPLQLQKDDLFLLCSDGLTDMLEDLRLESYIKKWQRKSMKELTEALCQEALQAGGKDNITCLAVRVKKLDKN